MNDNKAEIVVDGDVSPLRQKLREGARDLKQFGEEGKSSIERVGGPLKALQEKFIAIGAVLAGGAVFKEAVSATAEWTQESVDLAAALGMSATAASDLKSALASENVSVDEFVTAGQKLSAVLRTNEDDLKKVGLVTRDAAGNLRPLNELTLEAIGLLSQYKAGTDRAVASDILFGRGFKINGDLAKINSQVVAEYTEKQRALGVVMSEENVQAFAEYEEAGKNTDLMMRGIKQTIGNALMPVLTKLAEWFISIGPAAIVVLRGAIGGLIGAFWALKNGVTVVWEVINAMVVTVAEPLRALAAAIVKIGTGDFRGAWGEFQKAGETMVNTWKGALQEIESSSEETRQKIWNLFAQGGPTVAPGNDGKSANGLVDPAKDKKAKDTNQMSDAEWAMEEAAHLRRTLYEIDQERNEYHEAANKAVLEADKKLIKEMDDIQLLRVEGSRNAELARIDEMQALAQQELDMGRINQAEYLARLGEFNQQRLAAEQLLIDQKRDLALQDPDQNPVELERLEQERADIRRRYRQQDLEIQRQQALESQSIWRSLTDSLSSLWDKGVQALMNGTLTWRNAFKAVGAEVASWFATKVVGNMIKEWIAGQARKLAVLLGFTATEKSIQAASSAATVGIKTAETTAVSSMNAVQAGTGAAASQAPIPIIGPLLALAAMATVFAAVSALGKKKSAMNGYDVPKGLNPMTQLHEEEMVLPKQYANVIRGMAAGNTGQGNEAAAQPVNVNISAMDSRSVRDLLLNNPDALAEAIRKARRNGF